ncbi:hypothetical protein UACE39S_04472 [Ureibacillus acetophenoni]
MSEREILTDYVYQIVVAMIQNGVEDVVIESRIQDQHL